MNADALNSDDEALQEAAERRATWLADCARGDWDAPETTAPAAPTVSESLKRFVVGGLFDRKKK